MLLLRHAHQPTETSQDSVSCLVYALVRTDWFTVRPVRISVTVRVKPNLPEALPPSWPARSISTNPGAASSPLAHVRIGTYDFGRLPGLVCDPSLGGIFARCPRVSDSVVAALIAIGRLACSSVISASLSRRIRRTNIGNIGAN